MRCTPEEITTDRLTGERLRRAHFGWLCELHRDPKVMAHLGGVRSAMETGRYLKTNMAHWSRHGHGLWMLRSRAGGRFVGRAGLRYVELQGVDEVELAYALSAESRGCGLATEVGQVLIDIAFGPLALSELVCFAHIGNWPSRRVMEKLGFADPRPLDYKGTPCVLYRLQNVSGTKGP